MELIYRTKTVSINIGSGVDDCKAIYDFVSPYTDKVSYVSGETQIKFNDRFYFNLPNGFRGKGYLILEDTSQLELGNFGYWATGTQQVQMTLKIAGPVFIIRFVRVSNPTEGYGTLYWISESDYEFFNLIRSNTLSIDAGSYYDARVNNLQTYSVKTLIPFGVTPQKIAYTSYAYISNSDNILIRLNDIYSCSTITRDSLITISGQNYYAIGTNFLIQVDAN